MPSGVATVATRRVSEAAYVYPTASRDVERRFDGEALRELSRQLDIWLALAGQLLATGVFPRNPEAGEGCRTCAYAPFCGREVRPVIRDKLGAPDVPPAARVLAEFVTGGGPDA